MFARPKILVVALETLWYCTARLPKALQEAGFEVGVACLEDSYLAATRFCERRFFFRKIFGMKCWLSNFTRFFKNGIQIF
jgi:hypothetical protein